MATKSTPTKKKTKKKRKIVPAGYDSRLEYDLHKNELKNFNYHPEERIPYVTTSTYEPDFTTEICIEKDCKCTQRKRCGATKEILVEVKGRFRERKEASKYIHIRNSLEEAREEAVNYSGCHEKEKDREISGSSSCNEREIVFIFQDADKPMPFAGKRKDGTKQTHGEWAEKNGFKYACVKRGLSKTWLTDLM